MGALSLMILFVGFLTTGATRHKVYRAWGARIGGRISCIVVSITFISTVVISDLSVKFLFQLLAWYFCST